MTNETGLPWEERLRTRFIAARQSMKMTQADVAREMRRGGFSWHQQTVQRFESGERAPRLNEAVYLARLVADELNDLKSIQTFEDVKMNLIEIETPTVPSTSAVLLQRLNPIINHLCEFITLLTASLSAPLATTALVWGLMTLLIRVCSIHLLARAPI